MFFFFQAEDGIRDLTVTGVQTCALPVAMNQTGEKLSKQTRAAPLTVREAPGRLWQALRFLGQEPPTELAAGRIAEIWNWALADWRTERNPTRRSIPEGDAG